MKGIVDEFKWDKKWVHNLQRGNGAGGNRPRPFIVIVIWADFVLAKNHGSAVTSAQVSSVIGIMHPC